MSKVVINKEESTLDNLRVRDREMIPEVTTATEKVTETIKDPDGKVVGISKRITRTSAIVLHPEEYYELEKKRRYAKETGSKTKETGKEKRVDRKT